MKVAFLTSSRADFGIYLPLLKAMREDSFFDIRIIAFGTHLSSFHGYTLNQVAAEGFTIDYTIETVLASDTACSISTSMALASMKFAAVWDKEKNNYDLVFCLGDRYEMFSAVSAGIPFGMPFAHIHGGETTLGAIDNKFRHCLTLFSSLHFTATDSFAQKVKQINAETDYVYAVGALSLDNLQTMTLLNPEQFFDQFNIDIHKPSILVTFHPETIAVSNNEKNAYELITALDNVKGYQIIITMPNADTAGNRLRSIYKEFTKNNQDVCLVENFGTLGYFSCMKHSKLVVGNSSSGIIEAASLGKYVVNIGERQKGRATSDNVLHCSANKQQIISACLKGLQKGEYTGENIYYRGGAAQKIIDIVKNGTIRAI